MAEFTETDNPSFQRLRRKARGEERRRKEAERRLEAERNLRQLEHLFLDLGLDHRWSALYAASERPVTYDNIRAWCAENHFPAPELRETPGETPGEGE